MVSFLVTDHFGGLCYERFEYLLECLAAACGGGVYVLQVKLL
jgi:hypothetical protein